MTYMLTVASREYDTTDYRRWAPVTEHALIGGVGARNEPTGLLIGDAGSSCVFICETCGPSVTKSLPGIT